MCMNNYCGTLFRASGHQIGVAVQISPAPRGLRNIGGFTDGDRSAYLADYLGAESITLAGFDFEKPAEKPGMDVARKRMKLVWARRYLEALAEIRGRNIAFGDLIEIA